MKKLIISLVAVFLAFIILLISLYFYLLTPVNKNDKTNITFVVNNGESRKIIITNLKKANLIRNKEVGYIYSQLHKDLIIKAGTFSLKRNMNVQDIFALLASGKNKEREGINITFKEGEKYEDYISNVSQKLKINENEFAKLMADQTYLNNLIEKYWFLTNDILNEEIYYPLEGYLFPDTYNFAISASATDVIKTILDNTEIKLNKYKKQIESNDLTIHEIMTLASIVELEGNDNSDRAGIASVFINRINANMPLGSDVTTYYAAQKTFQEDLTTVELNECNAYNTRSTCFIGLPVGPVSNPGLKAIKAAIYPEKTDYLFFVSDKNGKIYFNKTNKEHEEQVKKLKDNENWYIYE